jgi:hypothetical protein
MAGCTIGKAEPNDQPTPLQYLRIFSVGGVLVGLRVRMKMETRLGRLFPRDQWSVLQLEAVSLLP